jgi:hypothetical protein
MTTTAVPTPIEDIAEMTPEQRLDFYEEIFFDSLSSFCEFCRLPVEQRRHILQDVIDDCAATDTDGIGMFTRAQLVEFLRQDDWRVAESKLANSPS